MDSETSKSAVAGAQPQKVRLVARPYILPFVLITSLFFLWGAAHAILDVLNKHFQLVMHISRAQSALVQVMFYLGYFIMAIPAGIVISRRGYRQGVITGLVLYGAGALLFWPGSMMGEGAYGCFLFSLFVIACGLVFLETAANPYVTELGDRATAASRLNLAQSFNGLGCICGPLLGGMLLFGGRGEERIALPYVGMGIVVLAVALVFTRVKLPEIAHEPDAGGAPDSDDGVGAFGRLLRHRFFVFGVAALLCYEIAEIGINSFFVNFVTDYHWLSPHDASILLSLGGLGLFMVGRVVGSLIMQRVSAVSLLRVCAVGTVAMTLLVVLPLGGMSAVALVMVYVFESIMFPTVFALSLRGLGGLTKRASSLLMMTPVGGAIGPLLMGLTADATNMSVAFLVPLMGFVVVLAYSFVIRK